MSGGTTSRRAFLLGGRSRPAPPRPPWATEARIVSACTRCDACIQACPEAVLRRDDTGFPTFHPKAGACVFCGACAEACLEPVFDRSAEPWEQRASVVAKSCLAHGGVHCETCRDSCEPNAIRFRPRLGGPPVPEIEIDRCTGCGGCIGPCPVNAIALSTPSSEEAAA